MIKQEFQVEKQKSLNKKMYENDLIWNMGIEICYHSEIIKRNNDSIRFKRHGTIQDSYMCNTLYNIHTASPIIKEAGEQQNLVLDADYSKVDIPSMVADLKIMDKSKTKLQATLEKFLNLFGGGLGRLSKCKPAKIKLKKSIKTVRWKIL